MELTFNLFCLDPLNLADGIMVVQTHTDNKAQRQEYYRDLSSKPPQLPELV